MKTTWEERVLQFRRGLLKEFFDQCSIEQQGLFIQIFGTRDVPLKKLDNAIDLCERTVIKNRETGRLEAKNANQTPR